MVKIVALLHPGEVRTVLDPACGSGTLLACAGQHWHGAESEVQLLGQDSDHVLTELTRARLAVEGLAGEDSTHAVVVAGDTLRADAHAGTQADVVLCNPPANERDWDHAELATDPRWVYGQPPRTEPELAWIQHATAALAPGGVAVLVVQPSVAARRAGRRIRSGLLRSGVLRTVIALPPARPLRTVSASICGFCGRKVLPEPRTSPWLTGSHSSTRYERGARNLTRETSTDRPSPSR